MRMPSYWVCNPQWKHPPPGQSGEARIFLIQDDNLTAEVPLRRSILQSTLRQKYRSTGRHNPQRDGGPEKGLYRLHPIALPIGTGGCALSGGQRQRIGLARAVYGGPCLVILDEPNSNLDDEGESALVHAISELKRTGTTVVIISHRPSILGVTDQILVLAEGTVRMFGNRTEVLARLP